MNLRKTFTALAAATLTASVGLAGTAQAAPIDQKRRQAAALEASIAANGERISMLAERLNGARYRVAQAQAGIAEAQRRTAEAQAQTDRIAALLANRAATIYKGATTGTPLKATNVKQVNELGIRSKYAAAAAERDDALLEMLQRSREELAVQRANLERQKAAAAAERDSVASAQRQVEAANAQQRSLLGRVKGEIAMYMAAEQARRNAAARAAALAAARRPTVTGRTRTGNPERFPNVPAPSGRAATAIAFARAQLGKPYRYATSGPNTYDCSGLTMAAWGAAGVSLPHFSGAQYRMLPHVPLSAIQPGDLVFYGPNGSNHVSLYIGGGMVITAPQTGDVVKIAPLRPPMGVGRPG
ncbi:MAG: NlpC/P60 family protein [Actinomycetes bacterium]